MNNKTDLVLNVLAKVIFLLIVGYVMVIMSACCPRNGTDGANGQSGVQGIQGDIGPQGETGSQGEQGQQGETGEQGEQGEQGLPGEDATASEYTIVALIDPCGSTSDFNEVLFQTAGGTILAHYSHGDKQFLTELRPGSYVTTDYQRCYFTVNADYSVTW